MSARLVCPFWVIVDGFGGVCAGKRADFRAGSNSLHAGAQRPGAGAGLRPLIAPEALCATPGLRERVSSGENARALNDEWKP